ncbi:hypothetical protein IGJ74_001154 [Enterococcus sp. AZ009]|uniref:hypothetical protein n=1 Tax=Enterococcus sp. AZ009 TaxID=2774766 RepID=UPI003D30177B
MSELVNKSEVLDIWNNYWITDMTTLDAENQLRELATVELKSAPQLNENQKALVIWMQENECYTGDPLESISDLFLEATPSDHFPDLPLSCVEAAYQSLTNQQKLEMVSEYLKQYSEQEAE